ncbi:MAG: DinB family protein [Candidatus Hydrogenedentes bacterium]|nr:DinB family protein [Candidatus Hydrogenedentota bacterium]
MNDQLQRYIEHFLSARDRIDVLIAGLTFETFNQRPASGGWSIAEVVDHLCILGEMLLPRIDVAIDEAGVRGWRGNGPFRYPFLSRLFIKSVGPLTPNKRGKMKAPKIFAPSTDQALDGLVERFRALQDKLVVRCRAADGINLRKPSFASPASPLIRVRLGAWIEAIAMHQLRHFQQIDDIRASLRLNDASSRHVV